LRLGCAMLSRIGARFTVTASRATSPAICLRKFSSVHKRKKQFTFHDNRPEPEYETTNLLQYTQESDIATRVQQIVNECGVSDMSTAADKFTILSRVHTDIEQIPNTDLGSLDSTAAVTAYLWSKRNRLLEEKESQEAIEELPNLKIFTEIEDEDDMSDHEEEDEDEDEEEDEEEAEEAEVVEKSS